MNISLMRRILCLLIVFAMSITVCCANEGDASEQNEQEPIMINAADGYSFYDDNFHGNVIAFQILEDGTYRFLTETEVRSYDDLTETSDNAAVPAPHGRHESRDYYEYYVFNQTAGPVNVLGDARQVSAWVTSGTTGATITITTGFTVSESFSASISTAVEKAAVRSGASISWVNSAARSTSYSLTGNPNMTQCIYFRPYYRRVFGSLSLYSNWDGLISTTYNHYGDSVKTLSTGEPDGIYYLYPTP